MIVALSRSHAQFIFAPSVARSLDYRVVEVARSIHFRAVKVARSLYCRAIVAISLSSRAVEGARSVSIHAMRSRDLFQVAPSRSRDLFQVTPSRSRDLFQVAPSRARTPFIAAPPSRSRTPLRRPPARPSSHRTIVRSASCAIEALKLHFNCAVVHSSFIAPSSANASLRRHALNLHWPILFDACRPLGVEFFRPFYLTHVIRLASNFPPIASLILLAMSIETC